MAGAACITVAYATSDGTAYNAFAFFACTFPFASSPGACVSLLHRNALRAAHESTLGAGPSPPQGATPPSARCACHGGDTRYCKSLSVAHTAAHVAELGPSAAARPPDDEAAPAPHLSSVTGAASRDLAFPVALPLLRCGRCGGTGTRGRVDRAGERARRKREVEERASRSSGISVTVEVQVTEEQAEDDFVPTEDGYHLVEEEEEEEGGSPPKARGSQGSSPSVVPQGKPR
ncbi:hypothetical protein DMC30DRAFT_50115 [Rhodotorula diobovata]|uniref:Uncharacterized protein n=1 Tax=Rhodotorula diobovata TaxID=5288 RepID=A0A5C5FP00_9BASI|nr:hypothetical protein DMC30DRAFT_50115 [Rhodotorula diobovata]